ncbi:MAG: helix-turn-helix domain-containing protein [Treponema sp.]|nr:helix-turn-helix domain-containing protein [Treponema sp.]
MKISSDILNRELKGLFSFAVFGSLGEELGLERPLFLRSGADIKDGQIYIADETISAAEPRKAARSVLLCLQKDGGLEAADKYLGFFESIFAFKDVLIFDVYNAVQNIYSRFDEWDADLQNILIRGSAVQAMLDCSDRIFNNPLILHDSYYKVIGFSKKYADAFPTLSFMPREQDAAHIDLSEYDIYSKQRAVLFPTTMTGVRSLYVNIFQQNRLQYRLLVLEYSRKFYPSDSSLLEHLAERIQPMIADVSEDAAERMRLSGVIRNILTGEYTEESYIKERFGKFNWLESHTYMCMKISLDSGRSVNFPETVIHDGIKDIVPGACLFEHEGAAAVFINLTDPAKSAPAAMDIFDGFSGKKADRFSVALGTFLIDHGLKAGSSVQFSGRNFRDIKFYYKQAEIALELGSRNAPMAHLYYFNDFAKRHVLEASVKELPASMLCAPELMRLRDHDLRHKTELLLTASKYLQNHLSHTKTSIELKIHRSTLKYRLDRIRDIGGFNIEESENQWYLLLSLKLLELEESGR